MRTVAQLLLLVTTYPKLSAHESKGFYGNCAILIHTVAVIRKRGGESETPMPSTAS